MQTPKSIILADGPSVGMRYFEKFFGDSEIHQLPKNASFGTLLVLLAGVKGPEVVLFAHSWRSGIGLTLGSGPESSANPALTTSTARALTRLAESGNLPRRSPLRLSKAKVTRLIEAVRAVQARSFDLVEFRGCVLGKNVRAVQAFRDLFGVKRFTAVDMRSWFYRAPVRLGSGHILIHRSVRARAVWHEFFYVLENRSVVMLNVRNLRRGIEAYMIAEHADHVQQWIREYVDPTGCFTAGETCVPLHFLWDRSGDRPRPLFPMQPGYSEHVVSFPPDP